MTKNYGFKRLTIEVPEQLFEKVKIIAVLQNSTLKLMVNNWLYEKVKEFEDLNKI